MKFYSVDRACYCVYYKHPFILFVEIKIRNLKVAIRASYCRRRMMIKGIISARDYFDKCDDNRIPMIFSVA